MERAQEKHFRVIYCWVFPRAVQLTRIAFCLQRELQGSSQKISFLYGRTNLACQSQNFWARNNILHIFPFLDIAAVEVVVESPFCRLCSTDSRRTFRSLATLLLTIFSNIFNFTFDNLIKCC